MTAKAKINMREGLIELEGSEEFVAKHLTDLNDLIKQYASARNAQGGTLPPETPLIDIQGATPENITKPAKPEAKKVAKPARAKDVQQERFEYLEDGEIQSLEDFFKSKAPKNEGDNMAIIGYYITHVRGAAHFTEGNIEFGYRALKIDRPNHLRQIMANNKSQRDFFDHVSTTPGAWKLTRNGQLSVEQKMKPKTK